MINKDQQRKNLRQAVLAALFFENRKIGGDFDFQMREYKQLL